MAEQTQSAEKNESAAVSTTEEVAANGENTATDVNDAEFSDGEQKTGEEKNGVDSTRTAQKSQKPAQSKEQNAEYARQRREAERQAELKSTREKAIIEALRGKNPYTNEEMKDSADVEEYLAMREIDDNGGDPVGDFHKYQKDKRREAEQRASDEKKREEWFRNDVASFHEKYPDVNLDEIIKDEKFKLYAAGKVGNMSMVEIFEGFSSIIGGYEEQTRKRAAQIAANAQSSPGSLSGNGSTEPTYISEAQYDAMSESDRRRYHDKIKESMRHWYKS